LEGGIVLIGAIIGDIVGSRFEFNNHRNKNFELFTKDCHVTDDSIMTLAVAKAIMETERIIKPSLADNYENGYYSLLEEMSVRYMREIGRKYPDCGYGERFIQWVFCTNPEPYNSFGNGAAMRISPVGFIARTESEVRELSEIVTSVTHNHEEGLKGAEATALAIFMARNGCTKSEIRNKINRSYYPLNFTIDGIRDSYQFNETCQDTVPQAIVAFLESSSFEDAIRTAISVGGDSDTLAAITGSIAEAYYGVPEIIRKRALTYLDDELRAIYDEWCEFTEGGHSHSKFKVLTKYIGKLSDREYFGDWVFDYENDGSPEHPKQMPFVQYDELVKMFVEEFYQFSQSHPEYKLMNYRSILEDYGIKPNTRDLQDADVELLDAQCILAMIMCIIRFERFGDGLLLKFLKEGIILKWLRHLKTIDDSDIVSNSANIRNQSFKDK
jgi:ADP-ribosylglycohydrolase